MNPRRQGDLGEFSAIDWLHSKGYDVFTPLGHSRDVDLIGLRGTELLRVQVKTSTLAIANGRYEVHVCTAGGNQSWNGIVKFWEPDACDYLFVLVANGRRFFIPADQVEGRRTIIVGGPKYAAYEIERGRPIMTAVEP